MKKVQVLLLLCLLFTASTAMAGISKEFRAAFEAKFIPAVPHKGLVTAAVPLELDKIKTFLVVKKGGVIPAERAAYIIAPAEYDYIGALVRGDAIKTRNGSIYTHLDEGTVMALSGVVYSGDRIYLKMISLESIKSNDHPSLKPTKVTVELGFEFPQAVYDNMGTEEVFGKIGEWVTVRE